MAVKTIIYWATIVYGVLAVCLYNVCNYYEGKNALIIYRYKNGITNNEEEMNAITHGTNYYTNLRSALCFPLIIFDAILATVIIFINPTKCNPIKM